MRSKNPECYWLVMRYFTVRQLTVRLHEDLHPHPKFEMWVDVKTADGVHLTNVQVHAMWCVGWSVGVVLCCDVACVCGGWQGFVGGARACGAQTARRTTTPAAPSCSRGLSSRWGTQSGAPSRSLRQTAAH